MAIYYCWRHQHVTVNVVAQGCVINNKAGYNYTEVEDKIYFN